MITHLANLVPTALLQRELVQHLAVNVLAVSKTYQVLIVIPALQEHIQMVPIVKHVHWD